MKRLNSSLLSVALVACMALPVQGFAAADAQQQPAGAPMGRPMGHPMGAGGMMNRDAMQQQLHDQLKLTSDQEAAWKTFTDSMKQAHSMPAKGNQSTDWSTLTMPQRAEKMLEMMKQRVKSMESNVNAMKAFYAKLTPEQQKAFDAFHANRGPMMQQHMGQGMPGGMNHPPMNR